MKLEDALRAARAVLAALEAAGGPITGEARCLVLAGLILELRQRP